MADAAKAMQQWDGQELVGQKLSVKIQTIAAPQQLPGMQPAVDLDERDGEWGCAQPCAGDAVPGAGEVGVCRERICFDGQCVLQVHVTSAVSCARWRLELLN